MPRSTRTVAAPEPSAAASKRTKASGTKAAKATKTAKTAAAKTTKGAAGKKAAPARGRARSATSGGGAGRGSGSATKAPAGAAKRSGPAKSGAAPVLDKFLEEQRSLLLEERASYLHQAESLRLEAERLAEEMEPGDIQFDEESGEGATINVERERDLAMSAQARAAVDEIDRALDKIVTGTYGICEQCGQPIPKARLKALPYASLCVACKSGGLSRR